MDFVAMIIFFYRTTWSISYFPKDYPMFFHRQIIFNLKNYATLVLGIYGWVDIVLDEAACIRKQFS